MENKTLDTLDLLTVRETAEVLRVSPRNVRRVLATGDLKFERKNSIYRYRIMTDPIDLLTVNEAARVLRISPIGVRRLLASRDLRYYKVRGSVRIRRKDIVDYLENVALLESRNEYRETKR